MFKNLATFFTLSKPSHPKQTNKQTTTKKPRYSKIYLKCGHSLKFYPLIILLNRISFFHVNILFFVFKCIK